MAMLNIPESSYVTRYTSDAAGGSLQSDDVERVMSEARDAGKGAAILLGPGAVQTTSFQRNCPSGMGRTLLFMLIGVAIGVAGAFLVRWLMSRRSGGSGGNASGFKSDFGAGSDVDFGSGGSDFDF